MKRAVIHVLVMGNYHINILTYLFLVFFLTTVLIVLKNQEILCIYYKLFNNAKNKVPPKYGILHEGRSILYRGHDNILCTE
jgi:hypothetical protein